ncbi:MAG: aconitase/3-isopropylmalate dehydratase large subunit family protein [candidate division Zixibacteria bacterium]
MGKTLAEKILGAHAGNDVSAGEIAIASVDICIAQDGTGPLAIRQLEKLGIEKLANPDRVVFFLDHSAPSSRKELSNDHMFIRQFAKKMGARVSEVGKGICHVVINEKYVNPGEVMIGADSHTCTGGALASFATGMGSTDVGIGMAFGKTWFRVPETFKIYVTGEFKTGVFPKDLILHLIGLIGADGATYKALEFCGPTIEAMDMSGRFTLSNMAVEAGAKVGLIASDETTHQFLDDMGRGDKWKPLEADSDASYERVIEIDVSTLVPTVSYPHTVDNTHSIDEAVGINIDQVFLGTCTNSRIEDWEIFAKMVKGKKLAPDTRFVAVPGSEDVLKEAMVRGYYQTLVEFGAVMVAPGCGPCVGIHAGVPGDGEVCLTTQNRNFQGRMGNPNASIYLASPATAAATAIEGAITDPRKYVKELKSIGKDQVIDTEALKAVAHSAQKTVERVTADTVAKVTPKAKEASEKIEKLAKKAAAEYGPKAFKAAKEFEKTISKLASDASKAIKEAIRSRSKPKAAPSTKKSASKTAKKTVKKAAKKTVKKAGKAVKTVKKKTAKTKPSSRK